MFDLFITKSIAIWDALERFRTCVCSWLFGLLCAFVSLFGVFLNVPLLGVK